jgi:hypothetical protein
MTTPLQPNNTLSNNNYNVNDKVIFFKCWGLYDTICICYVNSQNEFRTMSMLPRPKKIDDCKIKG